MVSFPSSSVVFFRIPSQHALVFIQKTFCDLLILFFFVVCFLYCCLGMVREKRGGKGGQGEDVWSIKLRMFTYN